MDLLRSCYTGSMSFWTGATGTFKVKWYFVDDTAPTMPFLHLYGSRNWDSQGLAMVGPGEPQLTPQVYSKGAFPAPIPDPSHVCGPDDWFANGVPVDSPSLQLNASQLPICCFGGYPPPPSCIPWDFLLPNNHRSSVNLTDGQIWPILQNNQTLLQQIDPVFTLDLLEFQGHSTPACMGKFSTTGRLTINSAGPPVLVHLTNVEWNQPDNSSLWQVPLTAPAYAGQLFKLFSPFH